MLCDVSNINDPVERAIQKYKNHPSTQKIKETFENNITFSIYLVSFGTILMKIISLDTKKATHSKDVPTKIVKANAVLFSILISNAFNESEISSKFLSVLKLADATPVHKKKKKSRLEKSEYRPVSLLPNIKNFLKDACIDKCQNILKLYLQNFNVVPEKSLAPKIVYYTWQKTERNNNINLGERIGCLTN